MSILDDYRKDREALRDASWILLGDPLGERYDPDRVDEALNDTVLDFNLRTQMIKEELNIQVKEDVFDYDIRQRVEENGTLRLYGFPLRVGFYGRKEPGYMPVSLFDVDMVGYTSGIWYRDNLSPNRIAIITPSADGAAAGDSDPYADNIQVLYVAEPTYMDEDADYPDSKILAIYHQAFPYGAASRLLDEGDVDDMAKALEYDAEFKKWIHRALAEEFRGQTDYGGFRPA